MAKSKYLDRSGQRNANWRGGFESSCTKCGKRVWVKPSRADRLTQFCSKPCHYAWMSEHNSGKNTSGWRGGPVDCQCKTCRKAFTVGQGTKARGGGVYCSSECAKFGRRTGALVPCKVCGEEFYVKSHAADTAKYCSYECKHEGQRKTRTEEDVAKRRLDLRVGSLMWYSLRKEKRGIRWERLVGYTLDDLIGRLETTMPDGYDWQDYVSGRLHLDHIIPRSVFNYRAPEDYDFKRCWALSNLQLLPARKNMSKGARLGQPFQPALL